MPSQKSEMINYTTFGYLTFSINILDKHVLHFEDLQPYKIRGSYSWSSSVSRVTGCMLYFQGLIPGRDRNFCLLYAD